MKNINYTIAVFVFWIVVTAISSCKNEPATKNEGAQLNDQTPATVTDIDGNVYHTVKIGKQWWLKENLKTSRFQDGSFITEMESNSMWGNTLRARAPGWCYYQNNALNNPTYGKLYNWYAVDDHRNICPTGWHVPSDNELQVLIDYLGGAEEAGGKMKDIKFWKELIANSANDNSSGFSALPGGLRATNGQFSLLGRLGYFWSSTPCNEKVLAWVHYIYSNGSCGRAPSVRICGCSVRCIKD